MIPSPELTEKLIQAALSQARSAYQKKEVPIGAVIALETGEIIAESHNLVESDPNATSHAEICAIKQASQKLKRWRLTDAILCVTLEPCTMCLGAIKLARIPTIIYGASDPRAGALGSIYNLAQDTRTGPAPEVISGVRESECLRLLKDFFIELRCK